MPGKPTTYQEAGVDIDLKEGILDRLKQTIRSTFTPGVVGDVGGFGGLFDPGREGARRPILVASADGVGTKLKVAWRTGRHDTVGADLVNHCVNDILVQGAEPLFFLDYFAAGKLDAPVVEAVITGVARGCRENGLALLGGETAELPGMYRPGEYDLAGFIVGQVERDRVVDGGTVRAGDALVGVGSAGLHTNGYSLALRILLEDGKLSVDDPLEDFDGSVGDALLLPHLSYLRGVRAARQRAELRGMAHITGGGFPGNLPRQLPRGLSARVDLGSWEVPALFRIICRRGGVPVDEALRVFNLGIGLVAIVPAADAPAAREAFEGEGYTAWVIGEIVAGGDGEVLYRGRETFRVH
jgi:phosphoribosylformylglycinamidine cyclo-ligase